MTVQIICGDCLEVMRGMEANSVNCCVTSPPYWGLRDYEVEGQIGQEESLQTYVARLVGVFEEVLRVLRDDGTLWLNLGDSYVSTPPGNARPDHTGPTLTGTRGAQGWTAESQAQAKSRNFGGLKNKNLIGMPWRVAFALQEAGWYLRSEIVWHKPNPLPESVRDRPARCHEQIFLLSKSAHYWYDADAVRQPVTGNAHPRGDGVNPKSRMNAKYCRQNGSFSAAVSGLTSSRNLRDVWTIPTRGYKGAHFATFPPDLIRPCILAGCPAGGTVLDPFTGAGTTGMVALEEGRQFVGIELNPEYVQLTKDRLEPLLSRTTLSPYLEDLSVSAEVRS